MRAADDEELHHSEHHMAGDDDSASWIFTDVYCFAFFIFIFFHMKSEAV